MTLTTPRLALLVCLTLAPVALADLAAPPPPVPPAAPTFEGWTVKSDEVISASKTAQISKKLGAKVTALRNTIYTVKGKKVQVNVMVAASDAEADKLVASLSKSKAPWSSVRKGITVYEFVGDNKASEEMKKASASLSGN